jgi:hypothetical protein
VLATSLGAIHFVLRNGADKEQASSSSVGLEELTGITAPLAKAQPAIAPAPRKPYQVETILGDKQVVRTFN